MSSYRKEIACYLFDSMWQTMALLVCGALASICLSAYLSPDLVRDVLSREMNVGLIVLAVIIGFLTPGPRYIVYPLLALLVSQGMDVGLVVAYLSGDVLIEPSVVFLEIDRLGIGFFFRRLFISVAVATLAGLMASFVFSYLGMKLR